MNILAVDQGTSATKALVVTPDGRVLAAAEVALRPRYAPGGVVEQDPAELLASVIDAGREAVRTAGEPIAAVGVANQGETVLAWNRASGSPFTVAIGWQDRRAEATCRAHEQHRATLEQRTGLGLDAYFAAPKMRWLRDHLSRAGVVTTSDTWLLNRLTGAFVTDAATASRTMLLDLETADWSDQVRDAQGLGLGAAATWATCMSLSMSKAGGRQHRGGCSWLQRRSNAEQPVGHASAPPVSTAPPRATKSPVLALLAACPVVGSWRATCGMGRFALGGESSSEWESAHFALRAFCTRVRSVLSVRWQGRFLIRSDT